MKVAAAILLVGLSTAQAAEPITLTCKGTATTDDKKRPVSMDVVVNVTGEVVVGSPELTYGTVEGFNNVTARIARLTESEISFSGTSQDLLNKGDMLSGTIDRVTGGASAFYTSNRGQATEYALECRRK